MLKAAKPTGWLHMDSAGPLAKELDRFVNDFGLKCRFQIPQTKGAIEDQWLDIPPEASGQMVEADDTAYILFTSGTTGKPKGIIGTHQPLSHFIDWHSNEFNFNASDRFSMLSGLSHDPLLRDIFTPLWIGATLCIPSQDDLFIPGKLRSWMKNKQVTIAHMTPALGQILTTDGSGSGTDGDKLTALRKVFFGGDTLSRHHVEKLHQIAPSIECVNFYGATETPQAMGSYILPGKGDMSKGDNQNRLRKRIPIGQGIDGVQLLVLGLGNQPAGVGEIGEICVRTSYLAKGYLNDDENTQKRFIISPFTDVEDDRIYRTGDFGHYLTDGKVMFYGRSDKQVSIRGFRVELKEIETVISRHPGIKDCAVIARHTEADEQYLLAYLVGDENISNNNFELREYLNGHLPMYMIPSRFIALDRIPLTANGKLDLEKISSFEHHQTEKTKVTHKTITDTEKFLLELWKEKLGNDQITIYDNFYESGGHSLLSVEIIVAVKKMTGITLNPREFVYQTLGQLAAVLEKRIEEQDRRPIRNLGRTLLSRFKRMIFFGK